MARILILKGDLPDSESTAVATYSALKNLSQDEYFIAAYKDLVFTITDKVTVTDMRQTFDLLTFDLIYIRDFHGYEHERNAVAMILKQNHRKFINEDVATFQHISKLTQYIALTYAGLPVPPTIYSRNPLYLCAAAQQAGWTNGIVAKSIVGSNGSDNYLIASIQELTDKSADLTKAQCVLQPNIPNDFDYRIIVADENILLSYKRIRPASADSHLNNVKLGAKRQIVDDISDSIASIAKQAASCLGRNLAGVDILVDKESGQPSILEVNYNFGMHELEDDLSSQFYRELSGYLHQKASGSS